MHRKMVWTLVVLTLLLGGCDWRTTLGLRTPPPQPLPPGAMANPNTDPILQLRAAGVTVKTTPGPTLPSGQQVVFYRYARDKECIQGLIAYNSNRTVQSRSEGSSVCDATALLGPVGLGAAGDYTIIYGFAETTHITEVEIHLPNGKAERAQVSQGAFYVMQFTPGSPPQPIEGITFVGFDSTGKERFRRTRP